MNQRTLPPFWAGWALVRSNPSNVPIRQFCRANVESRASVSVAMVTGATRNLGLALVQGLAERLDEGDVVYLTGRDPDP